MAPNIFIRDKKSKNRRVFTTKEDRSPLHWSMIRYTSLYTAFIQLCTFIAKTFFYHQEGSYIK